MKYVDDLSKVNKEDIEHINNGEVISITVLPDADDYYSKVVVCTKKSYCAYSLEGELTQGCTSLFKFKPKKVRYLKTITELVDTGYEPYMDKDGDLQVKDSHGFYVARERLPNLGLILTKLFLDEMFLDKWLEIFTVEKDEVLK